MQGMSFSRPALLSGVLLGLVPVLLAWWALRADTSPPARQARLDREAAVDAVRRRLEAPPVPRAPAPPAPEPRPNPRARFQHDPNAPWISLRTEIRQTLDMELSPPDGEVSDAARDHYMDRTRERKDLLAAYEEELVDLIEHEADPFARLDAEITLAEVYLEQADVADRTWLPDHWPDRRVRRVVRRLEAKADVARDKARMVQGIAETEAARLGNRAGPLLGRLAHLDGG